MIIMASRILIVDTSDQVNGFYSSNGLADSFHMDMVTSSSAALHSVGQLKYSIAVIGSEILLGHNIDLIEMLYNKTPDIEFVVMTANDEHMQKLMRRPWPCLVCYQDYHQARLSALLKKLSFSHRDKGNLSRTVEDLENISNELNIKISTLQGLSKMYEQEAHRVDLLTDASNKISSSHNTDTLIDNLTELLVENMQAEGCLLWLPDGKGNIAVKASFNIADPAVGHLSLESGEGIAGWVYSHRSPLLIRDIDDEKEFSSAAERAFIRKSALTVPMIGNDEVRGIIQLFDKVSGEAFNARDTEILATICRQALTALEKAQIFDGMQKHYFETVSALAQAIEAKDPYTCGHSQRVCDFAMAIANELNFDDHQMRVLKQAALLHDIGKIGIKEHVLNKEEGLLPEEYSAIRRHAEIGESIITPIGFLEEERKIIRHHHEKYSGGGYPDGLTHQHIPLSSQILMVADALDAMISGRPYKDAMDWEDAVSELQKCAGTQFNPEVVSALIKASYVPGNPFERYINKSREDDHCPDELKQDHREIYNRFSIFRQLVKWMEKNYPELYSSAETVADLAVSVGKRLNLAPEDLGVLYRAALIRDLGHLAIDQSMICKPERLLTDEFNQIKNHPVVGANMTQIIPDFSKERDLILHHHETYDGMGYPHGLKGDDMSLPLHTLIVIDAYFAMVSNRPFRPAMKKHEAVWQLKVNSGKQFHPSVVEALADILREEIEPREIEPEIEDTAAAKMDALPVSYPFLIKGVDSIDLLVDLIEEHDKSLQGNAKRVSRLSRRLAEKIKLNEEQVKSVERAALLHNIGRVGVDSRIINKEGTLDPTEFNEYKRHPLIGANIALLGGLKDEYEIIRFHQESYDGRGYPEGRAGEQIPIGSQILNVTNAFDAMVSERPYRRALSMDEAKQELLNNSGSQFSPFMVREFIGLLDSDPDLMRELCDFERSGRERVMTRATQIIAVTSGKGGVGKSNVVLNLGLALAEQGKEVIILDADLGLANIDILAGITPHFTVADVFEGTAMLDDIMLSIAPGLKLIPGSSGVHSLSNLPPAKQEKFIRLVADAACEADVLLVDTGAGIASNVMSYVLAADKVAIVTVPEPTAITDAYAMIKVILRERPDADIGVVVNMARDFQEATEVTRNISHVARQFLHKDVKTWGIVYRDSNVLRSIKSQRPYLVQYPSTLASDCIRSIAGQVIKSNSDLNEFRDIRRFINRLSSVLRKSRKAVEV